MRPLSWLKRGSERGGKSRPRARGSGRVRRRSRWIRASLTLVAACALLGGGGIYLWYAGHVATAIEATTTAVDQAALDAGLGIARIEVRGLHYADIETVRGALNAKMQTPIYAFDPEAARRHLLEIGWIEWATVGRRWPNTVYVDIRERQPFALWQHNKRLQLIDRTGTVITGERLGRFNALPLIVGRGANNRAAEIVDLLSAKAAIAKRVTAVMLVSERRWNIRFDNGVEVRLPEQEASVAVERLAALQARHSILDRKLRAIDLRLPDRLIVQLLEPVQASARNKGKKT